MPREREIDAIIATDVFAGSEEHQGIFWELLGFHTGTGKFQAPHLMNDLAQTVCGGAPVDGGDFLCRVIRCLPRHASEGNSEAALRDDDLFGERFSRAFPESLGSATVADVRLGAARLLNDDNCVVLFGSRSGRGAINAYIVSFVKIAAL